MPLSSPSMPGERILLAVNDVCFFFLGGSAWVLINGIYAQIPSIILFFDGDYGVVSKITLCVTLSALLPIIGSISSSAILPLTRMYSKVTICFSNHTSRRCNDDTGPITLFDNHQRSIHTGVALVLWLALTTSLALMVWAEQILSRLTPLLVATVAGGIVGTTSSILYYPHAAITPDCSTGALGASIAKRQTTAMLFGTAASNLFVAILAISQQEKQFQELDPFQATASAMRTFFGTIAVLMGFAVLGFVGTTGIRRIQNTTPCDDERSENEDGISLPEASYLMTERSSQQGGSIAPSQSQSQSQSFHEPSSNNDVSLSFWKASSLHSTLNTAQCILNVLTFFLPGIVPYSVRDASKDENYNADALRYLVVSQLIAQTLGVLASSIGGSSDCIPIFLFCRTSSDHDKDDAVKYQLGCFLFLLWIPVVFFSFQAETRYGIGLPISFNAMLNFAYGYFNTTWFHLLAERNSDCQRDDDRGEPTGASSAVRVMGTWHQIGATVGSAIAFELVQNGALGQKR